MITFFVIEMAKIRNVIDGLKPAICMVMIQVAYAGLSILYKMAAQDGMSLSVLTAYRTLFATSFVLPLAFFMEIRKSKPKITSRVLLQAFFCGLFGVTLEQNMFLGSVALASATYATAMTNLIPAATFVLALCFGLERLNIRTSTGKAKVVGTLMGIGGATILTFYKSIEIHIWSYNNSYNNKIQQPHKVSSNQILGSSLAFGSCLCYAMWLIIQSWMSEQFPWQYTSAALMSVMSCIQVFIFALFMERDWNQWKLRWNIRLFTALYTGIVPSGIVWIVISWCIRLKGPLYASIFNPLYLVLVAIACPFILHENIYLGSIIGSIIIVLGLYVVLWGKSRELDNFEEKKPTKGHILEIITTNHRDDGNEEIKSHNNISNTTLFSFMTNEDDEVAREVQEQVKDGLGKGNESIKGDFNERQEVKPS